MGIEELTQEELVSWIRKNVPGIDEGEIVMQTLFMRSDLSWEKYKEASTRFWKINDQIIELIQPYADGPIKPGVKLRRFPVAVQQEYDRLNRERQSARGEYKDWFKRYSDTGKKIGGIQKIIIDETHEWLKSIQSK